MEYTREQIDAARKPIEMMAGVPENNRRAATFLAIAYIDGFNAGVAYAQDARGKNREK